MSMLIALVIPSALLGGGASFDEYLERFGKSYGPAEYVERRQLFDQAVLKVEALNMRPGKLWAADLNVFSDWRPDELARTRGYNKHMRQSAGYESAGSVGLAAMAHDGDFAPDAFALDGQSTPRGESTTKDVQMLPKEVDWRKASPAVVSPVRHQGGCGSCWAFAAVAAIQSHLAIGTGVLMDLSPQQVTSCTPNPRNCGGTGGCEGATAQLAFNYTITAGLTTLSSDPYTSGARGETGTCLEGDVMPEAGITGYEVLPANDADALAHAVAIRGPVAVSVAVTDAWYTYRGGIFDDCDNLHPDINHAVLLVGYGEENGTRFWIARNSWGTGWGEDGDIRLKRHDVEPCGVDETPEHGFGCEGGPSTVRVCGECGILSDSSYPTGAYIRQPLSEASRIGIPGGRRLRGAPNFATFPALI